MTQQRSRVVFGPELPQFGSWNWLGRDLVTSLSDRFDTQAFRDEIGSVDALVILKFLPPLEVLRELRLLAAVGLRCKLPSQTNRTFLAFATPGASVAELTCL